MHDIVKDSSDAAFAPEQKEYLEGFFSGVKIRGQAFGDAEPTPERKSEEKISKEEKIKNALHPLDAFPELRRKANSATSSG